MKAPYYLITLLVIGANAFRKRVKEKMCREVDDSSETTQPKEVENPQGPVSGLPPPPKTRKVKTTTKKKIVKKKVKKNRKKKGTNEESEEDFDPEAIGMDSTLLIFPPEEERYHIHRESTSQTDSVDLDLDMY